MESTERGTVPIAFPAIISRRRLRIARWFGRAAFLGWFGPPVVAALLSLGQQLFHWSTETWAHSIWSIWAYTFLCGVACGMASAILAMPSRQATPETTERANVEVDASGILYVTLKGKDLHIPREQITDAVVVSLPTGGGLDVHLVGGDIVRLELYAGEELARDLIGRLGFAPSEHRVNIRLASPQRQLLAGCVGAPIIFIAMIFLAVYLSEILRGYDIPATVLFVGTAALTYLLTRSRKPPEVVVGTDGVMVRRAFRTVYFPFADIEQVEAHDARLMFWHRRARGPMKAEQVATGDAQLVLAAAKRIREAKAVAKGGGVSAKLADLLGGSGLSLDALKSRLGSFSQNVDYRRGNVTSEELLGVLENADEDRARRIGAAILLQKTAPDVVPRIRIAASACADDDLRVALEQAAEDELSEATFSRATRKTR